MHDYLRRVKMLGYLVCTMKIKNIAIALGALGTAFYIFQLVLFSFMKSGGHPVIIWWTPLMWENEKIITCSAGLFTSYNCLLTKNREYINNSNLQAFLFYGSRFDIRDLPVPKNNKIWAIFHEESPRNVAVFLYKRTFDLFEITSTFSRNSDLPLTLQHLEHLDSLTDLTHVTSVRQKNYLLNEIAPVLYIQSDCDTPNERDAYVEELMKYIRVDSYGKCLNNKRFPPRLADLSSSDIYDEELLQFVGKYKFMIAFENAICEDYITEKLWRPLMVGTVPIYLGSPSVEDWLPNDNSAILAKNFDSPETLAEYVKKVNEDDDLYENYRDFKRGNIQNKRLKESLAKGFYGVGTGEEQPVPSFECFVCQSIHEGVKKRNVGSVYDCQEPTRNSGWEFYWRRGDCESRMLVDLVKNNVKLKPDLC